jgi:hypothetical protein
MQFFWSLLSAICHLEDLFNIVLVGSISKGAGYAIIAAPTG